MISIREISEPSELQDIQLRERAVRSRKANSRQLVAVVGESEVGYASIDYRPAIDCGLIYEIFVLPAHRSNRVGAQLIAAAEGMIKSLGCSRAAVAAHPLDSTTDQRALVKWYEGMGYEPVAGTAEHAKKLR